MKPFDSNFITLDELLSRADRKKHRKFKVTDIVEFLRKGELIASFRIPTKLDDYKLFLLPYSEANGIAISNSRFNKAKSEYIRESNALLTTVAANADVAVDIDASTFESVSGSNSVFDLRGFTVSVSRSENIDPFETDINNLYSLGIFVTDIETKPPTELIKLFNIRLIFEQVVNNNIQSQKELYSQILFSDFESSRFINTLGDGLSMLSKPEVRRRSQYKIYLRWCSLNGIKKSYKEIKIQRMPLWEKLREMSPLHFKDIADANDSEFKGFFGYVNERLIDCSQDENS